MRRRIGGERRPARVIAEPVGRRVLEVGDGQVRAGDHVPDGSGIPGPPRPGQVPTHRRAVLAARGDLGRPAVEREVDTLAPDAHRLIDTAVEQDVAARERRPGRRRIERGVGGPCWKLRPQAPVVRLRHSVDAEQRAVAPSQRADRGGDVVGAQERQALAVPREVAASVSRRPWRGRACPDRTGGRRRARPGSRPPRR